MANTLLHGSGTLGATLFTPVSSAVANIGTSTSLGYTIAKVVKVAGTTGGDFGGTYSSGKALFYAFLGWDTSNHLAVDDSTGNAMATTVLNTTDWWYVVLTYAGGANNTVAGRFHYKDLTTAGNWTHTAIGNIHIVGSGTTTNVWVVGQQDTGSSDWGTNGLAIGLSAAWGTVGMSDAQVESLSPNAAATSKTSDAWSNAAGHPDLLIECTGTGYKTDIGNHPSTYSTDANWSQTGAIPTGWTFDGQGGAAVPSFTSPQRGTLSL